MPPEQQGLPEDVKRKLTVFVNKHPGAIEDARSGIRRKQASLRAGLAQSNRRREVQRQ